MTKKDIEILENTPDGWKRPVPEEPGSENELFAFFQKNVWGQGKSTGLAEALSQLTGIPYLPERDFERLLRTRHEGKWVTLSEGSRTWDSGRDYAKENHADVHCSADDALKHIGVPKALWNHRPSLCLIIEDEKHRVGIAVTSLKMPFMGLRWGKADDLLQGSHV